jgi:hypothetical protein
LVRHRTANIGVQPHITEAVLNHFGAVHIASIVGPAMTRLIRLPKAGAHMGAALIFHAESPISMPRGKATRTPSAASHRFPIKGCSDVEL